MPARLIINADDFGLTAGINRSIEHLHQAGALTSATLMASGPAFKDAVTVSLRNPQLGVGCHVVLVDGAPTSPPRSIPSLLAPGSDTFRSSLAAFAAAAMMGQIRAEDIRTEALAQISKLQAAGISVTHLDTHKHAHLFPSVSRPLLDAATEAGIHAVRNPFEQPWSLALQHGPRLRRLQIHFLGSFERRFRAIPQLLDGSIVTTDGTFGISATGSLDRPTLHDLLQHLPSGTWELVCHPGFTDPDLDAVKTRLRTHRYVEHLALLDVVAKLLSQPGAPSLIHYGEIAVAEHAVPARITTGSGTGSTKGRP